MINPLDFKLSISSRHLILLASAYFTLALNWPFFSRLYDYLFSLEKHNIIFSMVLPLWVFLFQYVVFTLFLVKGLTRPLLGLLLIGCSIVSYMSLDYGIIFESSMIDNFLETDSAEAKTYLNIHSILYVTVLGLLPALLLLRVKVRYQPFFREAFSRIIRGGIAAVGFVTLSLLFYQNFASVGRNNEHVHQYIVPNQLVYSLGKYSAKLLSRSDAPFLDLTKDAFLDQQSDKPSLVIMVLGETARAQNFSYDGYRRQTNEFTSKTGFRYLGSFESCGTATAISVPCMFSFLDRSEFDSHKARMQSNVLDVIAASGYDVYWIDNNSSCKNVCERLPYTKIDVSENTKECDGDYCFDEVLLPHIDQLLEKPLSKNTLIVLHFIGSHGPTYFRRYPEKFRKFLPDCQRSDIQNCSNESIVNTYDNSILYTDFLLAQIANKLNAHSDQIEGSVLYMSDHGESLGERGLFLHGMPWSLAPEYQKRVPALLWMSEDFKVNSGLSDHCLTEIPLRENLSQDQFSHSLLRLTSVNSDNYAATKDIFINCESNHLPDHYATNEEPH